MSTNTSNHDAGSSLRLTGKDAPPSMITDLILFILLHRITSKTNQIKLAVDQAYTHINSNQEYINILITDVSFVNWL